MKPTTFKQFLLETIPFEDIEKRFYAAAAAYGVGDRTPAFNFLTRMMLKYHPEFGYQGRMYRVISIPRAMILNSDSVVDVLSYIRKKANSFDVVSWSSELKGAIRYHNLVFKKSSSSSNVFVILEQTGEGFDYRKWLKSYHFERGQPSGPLHSNIQVFEVLSPMTTEARIGLFFVAQEQDQKDYSIFTYDRFQQLKQMLVNKEKGSNINPRAVRYAKGETKTLSGDRRKSKVGLDYYDIT